jgi:2,3,4,5-tetrahydropyridine-2,6-dicarboxylate N-succinyltransferase
MKIKDSGLGFRSIRVYIRPPKPQALREEFMSSTRYFSALGLRRSRKGQTLDVNYVQVVELTEASLPASGFALEELSASQVAAALGVAAPLADTPSSYSQRSWVRATLSIASAEVTCTEDAYLRLQLLSRRLIKPHGIPLVGIFPKLPNLAWSNVGPVLPDEVESLRLEMILRGDSLSISHVDKFPYLVNYFLPSGVRIASGAQVRLGAYLGEGTTIMQAGFVNFNAGTEGNAMAGVFVAKDSDVGGGASIMGTLSGGGKQVISIGSKCLLGANSGIGISLGFGCTVAAGTYVTAGAKIALVDAAGYPVDLQGRNVPAGNNLFKGLELSGRDKLLFYTDSTTGQLVAKPNPKTVELNPLLHKNG